MVVMEIPVGSFSRVSGASEGTASGVVSVSGTCVGSCRCLRNCGCFCGFCRSLGRRFRCCFRRLCRLLLPVLALLLLPEESRPEFSPSVTSDEAAGISFSAARAAEGTVPAVMAPAKRIANNCFFSHYVLLSYGRICPFP